jgi:glucuronide carrier protein
MSTVGIPSTLENAARPHLPVPRILGYACGDAGCNIAFQMTGLFLLVFYTDVVGIDPVHAGNIFLFVKIWDAFADIFAGRMVDRTMTRWGKFRPFLLWYSVPLLLSNLLCFWIPVDGYGAKLAWAVVSYALLGLLYSLVNIPYGSLAGAMSQNPIDRSRLASARMVGSGTTILLLALILAPQIKASENLARTFLITAAIFLVIGTILFMITFLTARETVIRDVAQVSLKQTLQTVRQNGPLVRLCLSSFFYLTGQNIISALGIYIANDILMQYAGGNWLASVVTIITTGAVIYVAPFGPMITRTLGKKRGFIIAGGGALVGTALFFVSGNLLFALVGLFFAGVGMALLNVMTWALEADTVEYGEWKTGVRTEGTTYALFSFTRKMGQAIGGGAAAYTIGLGGYIAGKGVVQTDSAKTAIKVAAGFVPAAFIVVALAIIFFYPLTERVFRDVVAEVAARRAARVAEAHESETGHERRD